MIPLLLFVLLLFMAVSRSAVPGVADISDAAGCVLPHVLYRLALAGLLTTLILVLRSVISDRHPDSR
jgi:hypothetical protein